MNMLSHEQPVPDPVQIARRAFAHGLSDFDPKLAQAKKVYRRREFAYYIGETVFGAALLRSAPPGADNRPEDSSMHHYCHIGGYDCGQERWRFFPEFVEAAEVPGLSRVFEDLALDRYAAFDPMRLPYGSFANDRDPLSVRARRETAALLAGTGIAERLIVRPDLEHVPAKMDEASVVFLTMSPKLTSHDPEAPSHGRYLEIGYDDVLNAQGERVGGMGITIAHCDESTGVWTPKTELITPEEWEPLSAGPDVLLGCEAVPGGDFYTPTCLVVHRYRTDREILYGR